MKLKDSVHPPTIVVGVCAIIPAINDKANEVMPH